MIKQVWSENFLQELKVVDQALYAYNVVSLDTEFPGILGNTSWKAPQDELYQAVKFSIDRTNLIQLGLTLSDDHDTICGTWEFNFKFDVEGEVQAEDSIQFLEGNGLDFEEMKKHGIPHLMFHKLFRVVLCNHRDKLKWVTFHGLNDMAHLMSVITNHELPTNLFEFIQQARCVFSHIIDVKHMAKFCSGLHGGMLGLEKLARILGVQRIGGAHNAGSDSLLTSMVYSKMKNSYPFLQKVPYMGYLYGISYTLERQKVVPVVPLAFPQLTCLPKSAASVFLPNSASSAFAPQYRPFYYVW